jgi:threonyl-tRNA synthetase
MAEAVQELWPGTQVTIGPVIENGFYYDFKRDEPFTTDDLPVIEKKMREIIAAQRRSPRKCGAATRPSRCSRQGRGLQGRTDRRDPGRQDVKIYHQGDWFDLCRGPHMASTGQIGGLQADEGGWRLLARRQRQRDADPHLRHRLAMRRT